MADEQKNTQKESNTFFKGMPFLEMMAGKKGCCGSDWTEMIQKMMTMCCGAEINKEETTKGHKE